MNQTSRNIIEQAIARALRPMNYKGRVVQAIDNGDGTFRYAIDGKEFATMQKSAVQARMLASVRIDSKGFQDEDEADDSFDDKSRDDAEPSEEGNEDEDGFCIDEDSNRE